MKRKKTSSEPRRRLPAIGRLLDEPAAKALLAAHPRGQVVAALRAAVADARAEAAGGNGGAIDEAALIASAAARVESGAIPSLRRVINATGVVLHTGLGRAPLAAEAVRAVVEVAEGYSNLEFDLETGERGRRVSHVADLLAELTGAEAATVVNNNAAATLLALNTLARGAEVIVSRGQLVEIGGSFRMPEVMAASGAIMREVGTTNRTRASDYEKAIGDNTAAFLRVHPSNYRVVGFTESVEVGELAALAHRYGKICIDDLGSGTLFDLTEAGLPHEPCARESLAAGADVVCFSGDKLLGGPQAGILTGRRELIARIEANPLMRTYRVDKMTLAALAATLRLLRDERGAMSSVPLLAMLSASVETLERRAQELASLLRKALPAESFEVVADRSVAGGGSLPGVDFETRCVAWRPSSIAINEALEHLRTGAPAVVARASRDRVLFDVRTLSEQDIQQLRTAVARTANNEGLQNNMP
jgi:L-seryl-tRNA(Ser) seleniumtransferase